VDMYNVQSNNRRCNITATPNMPQLANGECSSKKQGACLGSDTMLDNSAHFLLAGRC
jgi:hypothetical protein